MRDASTVAPAGTPFGALLAAPRLRELLRDGRLGLRSSGHAVSALAVGGAVAGSARLGAWPRRERALEARERPAARRQLHGPEWERRRHRRPRRVLPPGSRQPPGGGCVACRLRAPGRPDGPYATKGDEGDAPAGRDGPRAARRRRAGRQLGVAGSPGRARRGAAWRAAPRPAAPQPAARRRAAPQRAAPPRVAPLAPVAPGGGVACRPRAPGRSDGPWAGNVRQDHARLGRAPWDGVCAASLSSARSCRAAKLSRSGGAAEGRRAQHAAQQRPSGSSSSAPAAAPQRPSGIASRAPAAAPCRGGGERRLAPPPPDRSLPLSCALGRVLRGGRVVCRAAASRQPRQWQ